MRNLKCRIMIESSIGIADWEHIENSLTSSLKDKDIFQISIIPDKDKDGKTTHYYYIFYKEPEIMDKNSPLGVSASLK